MFLLFYLLLHLWHAKYSQERTAHICSASVSLLLVFNAYRKNTNSLIRTPQPVAPALSGCLATVGVAWLLGQCGRGGGDAALISSWIEAVRREKPPSTNRHTGLYWTIELRQWAWGYSDKPLFRVTLCSSHSPPWLINLQQRVSLEHLMIHPSLAQPLNLH